MTGDRVVRSWLDPERAAHYRSMGLWGESTIVELVDEQAERFPDKLAVADDRVRWTYAELRDRSRRMARVLCAHGLGTGDPFGAQVPSCALLPLLHLAANRIGALMVPMATGWRRAEVSALVAAVRAPLLISVPRDGDFDLRAMHDEVRGIVPGLGAVRYFRDDLNSLEEELDRTDPLDAAEVAELRPGPDDPGHIMVSSGSTGVPKASVWSNNDTITMLARHTVDSLALTSDDVAAGIAPANVGSTGYVFPVLTPLLIGATSVMLEKWSPAAALELIARERATYATAIPTQMVMMLDEPLEQVDLSGLTRFNNAGAPLSGRVAEQVETRMGCRVQTIYGATDGGVPVMTSVTDPDGPRRTSVGRVLPGEEVELRDASGAVVPEGEPGEICWRGANKSYGYLNQPEYDNAAFVEGWFRSGDVGSFDDEGYLRIVGRATDMILRGGVNIFPFEIEDALGRHPNVSSAAVVGVPDDRLGERTCAVVVPRGPAPILDALVEHLAEQGLARLKHPEELVLVEELPTNQGGKLDRPAVRTLAMTQMDGAQ